MVREGITQEVDVLACDLAGKNIAVLLLTAVEKLKGVGPKLQSTAQVRDETIFHWWFTWLSVDVNETKTWFYTHRNSSISCCLCPPAKETASSHLLFSSLPRLFKRLL